LNNTPLHFAIESKDLKIIDLLVEYGADPSLKNNDQKNSLDLCFQERDNSLIKYFRSKS
jgi:ankyrin repeat protein